MRNSIIGTLLAFISISMISCGAGGDDPGSSYMPDMYYSRAYETYGYNNVEGEHDSLTRRGIHYNAMPVPGTVARGDKYIHHLTGDSAGLAAAQGLRNPLDSLGTNTTMIKEGERLYLIHCGICHGTKLDGNGPLFNGGNGPYIAKPADLMGYGAKLTDGHYFHVITFGIRTMGSYSSQLTPEQRWMVIKYIRSKQAGTAPQPVADSVNRSLPVSNLPVDTSRQGQ